MVRELKNSRATTKKFSRHFLRKRAPQSEHFWFVFPCQQVTDMGAIGSMSGRYAACLISLLL
ncbi:DUF1661 domain-containing protein [Porphyromonas gulae]|uniref:DUF1661 domain-containing protein n=1 Tax=Porphyromonas gulae TaxID=111105 RepID=UPI0026F0BC65|nr:DUF1661 domain-containing protein [Porphyromonas gulae]